MLTWAGHAALMGNIRIACKILVAKPEGKRQFGRLRRSRRILLECILEK
jgi:hypothetical protein